MRTLFLAAAVVTAYALLRGWPAPVHPILRACFAVLILVLGLGLWRRMERPATIRARPARPARWPDYLAVGLGVLAAECFFLFFFSAVPPRAEALACRVEETLFPERAAARSATDATPRTVGTRVTGNWLWNDQGRRQLPDRVSARPSNKPEVFLRPAGPGAARVLLKRAYVRAFALERFRDSAWSPLAIPPELLTAGPDGWIRLPAPSSRPGPVVECEIFHSAHPAGQDVFTALQGAFEAQLPELRRVAPGILRLSPLPDPEPGYNYRARSRLVTLDSLLESGVLAGKSIDVREAPEHLLALPEDEELRQGILDLASRTQGPTEVRLVALRKYLRKNFQYSLEVENPSNRQPLVNFLFHEKRGHCEFFATAGALFCRALGVPARIAYGWTGGRYYESPNLLVFRAREAHAWTEVYLRDIGWVIFDPTPPGALEAASLSIAPPDEIPPLPGDSSLDLDLPDSIPLERLAFLILLAGLLLVPLTFLLLCLRRSRPAAPAGSLADSLLPPPPGYLARFRHASARLGHPMPPGRTLRQHLAALADDNLAPPFSTSLLDYHYAVTYAHTPRDKSREKSLAHAIKDWTP